MLALVYSPVFTIPVGDKNLSPVGIREGTKYRRYKFLSPRALTGSGKKGIVKRVKTKSLFTLFNLCQQS